MSKQVTVKELHNTWGCVWVGEDGETHYGFDDCPISRRARLWLECAQGDAVRLLLRDNLAEVVKTTEGAYYSGQKRTVRVDIPALEASCERYWNRLNAQQEQHQTCHYCGQSATKLGFFDEPICGECGG